MFNKVILIGNLIADPEMRYIPSGSGVCNFKIAVNRKYKSGDETKEEVLFIGITAWGKSAENCAQYLNKGSQVLVEGRLQQQNWEADGQKRSKIEVVSESVKFMSKPQAKQEAPQNNSDIEPF